MPCGHGCAGDHVQLPDAVTAPGQRRPLPRPDFWFENFFGSVDAGGGVSGWGFLRGSVFMIILMSSPGGALIYRGYRSPVLDFAFGGGKRGMHISPERGAGAVLLPLGYAGRGGAARGRGAVAGSEG